jgi:hypothetical protein
MFAGRARPTTSSPPTAQPVGTPSQVVAGCVACVSVAEGDGEFAEPVSYRPSHQRWYVRHRLQPVTEQLRVAGLELMSFSRPSTHSDWLQLRARRR